jgi:hypothetical protein
MIAQKLEKEECKGGVAIHSCANLYQWTDFYGHSSIAGRYQEINQILMAVKLLYCKK